MNVPSRAARINERLVQYWYELRGDRPLPFEHEVNPAALSDIWDGCFLVAVHPEYFSYEYIGAALHEAYGCDLTGKELRAGMEQPHPQALFSMFQRVCRSAELVAEDGEFTNSRGMVVQYRSCVLPLAGRGGKGVSFLLGAIRWRPKAGAA